MGKIIPQSSHPCGPLSGSQGLSLGNYAESSPAPLSEGGNPPLAEGENRSSAWSKADALIERYALQIMARKAMLEEHYRKPEEDRPKRAHKVCACRRELRPIEGSKAKFYKPAVFQHKETGGTFYGGHIICGSPRACPLCAQKIGDYRAKEIRTAVDAWMASGGLVLFVTPTFPHSAQDSLPDLLTSFKLALSIFRKGRPFERIKDELGYSGLIRAMETTWGRENGWHPHSHELWFIRPKGDLRASLVQAARESRQFFIKRGRRPPFPPGALCKIQEKLWERWKNACLKSGLDEPSFQNGIRIEMAENEEQTRSRLAEYLAKSGLELDPSAPVWGADDELVRVHSKRGKSGRFTPFDFLREQYNPETTKEEKARFRELFSEFVASYRGMAAVFWSPGLKASFQIVEISDQESAENHEQPSIKITDIQGYVWPFVIGINDHRAQLLNRAAESGLLGVNAFLDDLLERYYLDHLQDDFVRLSADARYLLSLPSDSFESFNNC